MKRSYGAVQPYVTKDGSVIRELIHPVQDTGSSMSLAEAVVPPGTATLLHAHRESQEIYHVLEGEGTLSLGNDDFEIQPGDSILIRPGTPHRVRNAGDRDLKILCCCCPPYTHEDTEIFQ